MQCRCCMFEVENGKASCPVCGFPTLGGISPEKQSIIEEYRTNKLKNISIDILAYRYSINGSGGITEPISEYIKLADALSLTYGEVLWIDSKFESFEANRSIVIDISICKGDVRKECRVDLASGEPVDCGGLGIYLDKGFTIKFAVGNENNYHLTESISLLGI